MIALDTSGLLAALDPDQRRHDECAAIVLGADQPLLLSPFVLAELDYLVRRDLGVERELELLAEVEDGAYQLVPFDAHDVRTARALVERYAEHDIGLADASVVAIAERYDTTDVLTLDERHFRMLTTTDGARLRLLPADA